MLELGSSLGTVSHVLSESDYSYRLIHFLLASEEDRLSTFLNRTPLRALTSIFFASWAGLQYKNIYGNITSDYYHQYKLPDLNSSIPDAVLSAFIELASADNFNEDYLYRIAEEVIAWAVESNPIDHSIIAHHFRSIPDLGKHILLSSLCDADFDTNCDYLTDLVINCLQSPCKRLAQAAASFLCVCSGEQGRRNLNEYLLKSDITHKSLVKGIIDILC